MQNEHKRNLLIIKKQFFYRFLYRFPNDFSVSNQWKSRLGIDTEKVFAGMVCINHFKPDDIITNITLSKTAIPNIAENMDTGECSAQEGNETDHSMQIGPECCQKATSELNAVIDKLKELNSAISENYHNKMKTLMEQINQYKQRMNVLEQKLMSSSTPPGLANTLLKNSSQVRDMKKKIKKLQDSMLYRNKRLKAMSENRKTERDKWVEDDKIETIAKVCFVT